MRQTITKSDLAIWRYVHSAVLECLKMVPLSDHEVVYRLQEVAVRSGRSLQLALIEAKNRDPQQPFTWPSGVPEMSETEPNNGA